MTGKKKENSKESGTREALPMFAAIRVRGIVNTSREIKDTMKMLRLRRVNNCVIVPNDQTFSGMLKKAENFLTWGEIDEETLEKLVWKRGRLLGDKRIDKEKIKPIIHRIIKDNSMKNTGIKPVFRLSPPSKGHKPIKRLYPKGACGYRGADIGQLIKKMI